MSAVASLSDYLVNKMLDATFGITPYTPPATLYGELFTTVPSTADVGGVEYAGGNSYARGTMLNDGSHFSAAATRLKLNSAAFTFPTPTGPWSGIAGFGIRDASSGGNLLLVYNFGGPVFTYLTGELVQLGVGGLSITL